MKWQEFLLFLFVYKNSPKKQSIIKKKNVKRSTHFIMLLVIFFAF
jgi:hypothetical protein